MRVGVEPQFEIFVTMIGPPDLRPGEEEALIGSKAVDLLVRFLGMLGQRLLEGGVSNLQPAVIGDVFALGEFAVDVQAGERFVSGVLRDDRLGASL